MSARARAISFVIGPPRGSRASRVQSVIFPRPTWSRAEAVAWLKRHQLKASPVETLRGSYRAAQRPAGDFTRLRTIETSGHPHPLKNPRRYLSPFTIEQLTRDPREQGFADAKAHKPSSPPGWYTPTERGQYAEGYIAGGQGRKGRPTPAARLKPTRRNPRAKVVRPTPLEERAAVQLFQRFHGMRPKRINTVRVQLPRALMQVGPVPFMYYLAPWKGRETLFKHTFAKHARPMLAATHDGRALYLVGGDYDFTKDGIVDRPR